MTTINEPRQQQLYSYIEKGYHVVVAGDAKTPAYWEQVTTTGVTYLSLGCQEKLAKELAAITPHNSYARKNFAYIYAIRELGAKQLLETDDDTFLLTDPLALLANPTVYEAHGTDWPNPYVAYFEGDFWPRGLPLAVVNETRPQSSVGALTKIDKIDFNNGHQEPTLVLQCMVEGEPDLDAVGRMTCAGSDRVVSTDFKAILRLRNEQYGVGNTQNTLWCGAIDLASLYFPVSVPMRYADILKMHIAQLKTPFYYGPATAQQSRNYHDAMMDFHQEIELYLHTMEDATALRTAAITTVAGAYAALVAKGRLSKIEVHAARMFTDAILCRK